MGIMTGILLGIALAILFRSAVRRILLAKLRRDVQALGTGDYGPLLASYADNAVLRFNEGRHRWSGEHVGKDDIERFLQTFVAAGLQGRIVDVYISGWPWSMTILARFDDVSDVDGERLYANRTVLVCRTRWGKITHQDDFFEDTMRMDVFEKKLRQHGI